MLQEFSTSLERPTKERKLPCIWHPSGAHGDPLSPGLGGEGMLFFRTQSRRHICFLRLLLILLEADNTG